VIPPADVAVRPDSETPDNGPRRRTGSLLEWTRANAAALVGALVSVAAAFALFTRFSLNGALSRDESIYVYGSVRFAHGVPPYVSIFDPKTPVTTFLGGFGAGLARLLGHNQLYGIRVEFLVISVLTVLAVYLLALQLFGSVSAAVVAGIAFSCYTKFADDAMAGPDAKTPGVLFMVICMLLLARKRWLAAGVFAGLAFLDWQPLMWFPLICVVAALVMADVGRRRVAALQAIGGVLFPIAVASLYFLIAGAFSEFVTAAFVYPLTGTVRPPETFGQHIMRIIRTVDEFALTGIIFWAGSLCLLGLVVARFVHHRERKRAALTDPLVLVVAGTYLLNLLYALYDFQRAPDTLPFMPYPVLGLAGALAALQAVARNRPVALRAVTAGGLVVVLVMATFGFLRFGHSHSEERGLVSQRREACGIARVAGHHPVIALGNPTVLVLLHRVSPSNYIYLNAGVDKWKVDHTKGGFDAWGRQILSRHPDVITVDGWDNSPYADRMRRFLKHSGFTRRYVGKWEVYVTAAARRRSHANDVKLTVLPKRTARTWHHSDLPGVVPCPVRGPGAQ
jgi:hypothetical protein